MENFSKAHSVEKLNRGAHNKLKTKLRKMLNGYDKNDKNVIRDAVEHCVESDLDQLVYSDSDLDNMCHGQTSEHSENGDSENSSTFVKNGVEATNYNLKEENENLDSDNERDFNASSNETSLDEQIDEEASDNNSDSDQSFEDGRHENNSDDDLSIPSFSRSVSHGSDEIESASDPPVIEDTYSSSDLSASHDLSSSSTYSEFDGEGHLARAIMDKINHENCKPSTSGYIQIKHDRKMHCIEKNSNVGKNKIKENLYSSNPSSYSLNASDQVLPEFPNMFTGYNFTTTKLIKQNLLSYQESYFKPEQMNNVEITNTSINTSMEVEPTMNGLTEQLMELDDNDADESVEDMRDDISEQSTSNVEFHRARNGYVVILHHPAQLYVHGKVKVTGLAASVDIMGYKLGDGSISVYAPRFSYAQIIKTLPAENDKFGLFTKLRTAGLSVLATEDIVISIQEFDSVLHLGRLDDNNYGFVEAECPGLDIFQMTKKSIEEFPDIANELSCSIYSRMPYKAFEEIPVWPEIVKFGKGEGSKGVICGGKGTGKSTFLKYYINSLLCEGPVLVIDLDPGQAEFTVAGSLSVTRITEPIVGPNFTHLIKPELSVNIGMVNVLDNIERYISVVTQVLRYALKEEFKKTRCIINTMGMTNSLGFKIVTYITTVFPITFLVQMDSSVKHKCFEMLLTPSEIKRFYSVCEEDPMFENIKCSEDLDYRYFMSTHSNKPRGEKVTAKDKRYLCCLSYFRTVLRRNNLNLLSVRPYIVKLDSIRIATSCHIEEKAITSVINGKIVALCEENTETNKRIFTLEENALLCHGYGLIRGIDINSESVYLITSECSEVLSRVNVLLYCDWHPDLRLNDKVLPVGTFVPYRTIIRPHNKQLLLTPKRRFNPLQLIKIKRKNVSKSRSQ